MTPRELSNYCKQYIDRLSPSPKENSDIEIGRAQAYADCMKKLDAMTETSADFHERALGLARLLHYASRAHAADWNETIAAAAIEAALREAYDRGAKDEWAI